MSARLFMGIDGGGSKLRVAIVNADMHELVMLETGPANPSLIGRDQSQTIIRRGIIEALKQARLQPQDVAAVGIGIAGAASQHSRAWLLETLRPCLPHAMLVPSSDMEIALVGALAQEYGILLLCGTGSAVCGISRDGQRLQVGGWGYLLGDEGSGFWIGMQALRRVIALHDEGGEWQSDMLSRACLDALNLQHPRDLIQWLYRANNAPISDIAGLARPVLNAAAAGNERARDIIAAAAEHLVRLVKLARSRLNSHDAPIAFAGGLLDYDNMLSMTVARSLDLPERPRARHRPVIGAALLAKKRWSETSAK